MKGAIRWLLVLSAVALLTACGGGGGDSGDGGSSGSGELQDPVANLSGTWEISEQGTSTCPGEETYTSSYTVTVEQDGNNLTVTAPAGTFSGTIDGNQVSWTGSYPEDGGTTTLTDMNLTVSSDGDSLSGSATWTWSDGASSCSGSSQTINGVRTSGGSGNTGGSAAFSGFDDLDFRVGSYFDYSFSYVNYTNDELRDNLSGVVRVEFVDSVDITFDELGTVTFYETSYSALSGDDPPYGFPWYAYIGEANGVIYIGQYQEDGFGAAILFDANEGSVYEDGFMGKLSGEREETVGSGRLSNDFIDAAAVEVSEPFYDPECETIAGTEVCDDEYHDYQVREYYLPHIGFGGFYRSGTSIFSGGGFVTIHESTYQVGITDTNVYDLSTLP